MTPIQTVHNQYRGVNAHLHSQWQATGKWNRFHNFHIGQLMAAMKAQLIPLGYTAEMDESLQIRRVGDYTAQRPRSDLLIRDLQPQRPAAPYPTDAAEVQTLALDDLLVEDVEHPYYAVVIYADAADSGEPVAWVELLSPTNKGDTRDAYTYQAKRRLLLEQGLVFVEIDYLHETPPTFDRLPDYSRQEAGASAYRVVVIDPRPTYHEARVYLRQFGVDEVIPTVTIPLNGGDTLVFDFDRAYQQTFTSALYGHDMDYAQFPLHFERYTADDQARITRRMVAVLEAAQSGHKLDNDTPLTLPELDLSAALARIKVLVGG